jgi:hypothetical protein
LIIVTIKEILLENLKKQRKSTLSIYMIGKIK